MLVRVLNVGVVLLWLVSMSALFVRDILPSWLAGNAPPAVSANHLRFVANNRQAAIYGPRGPRVGTNWVEYIPTYDLVIIKSTTVIDGLDPLPSLRIENRAYLRQDGALDHFVLTVHGAPIAITLEGEDYESDFACALTAGEVVHRWQMDSETTRTVADMFKPLTHLPHLRVGHSWRMRILDPLAVLTGRSQPFKTVLVRVTGRQDLDRSGEIIKCYVVEAPGLRALVAPKGEVLSQRLEVPGLGSFTCVDEAFDAAAVAAVRSSHASASRGARLSRRTADGPGTTRPTGPEPKGSMP